MHMSGLHSFFLGILNYSIINKMMMRFSELFIGLRFLLYTYIVVPYSELLYD